MRTALADTRRFNQTSTSVPLPAPVGGWNSSENYATMDQLDAIIMDNCVPEQDSVSLRGGDEAFATGMSGNVETLIEYKGFTANQLIAASDGNVYNITSGTPISKKSGMTNALWQGDNFNARMFLANGADTMQTYDGTTMSDAGFTGVTLSDIINVTAIRDRLWLVEKDSGSAWYGAVAAITGAVTEFDVGEIARNGYLVNVETWSVDAGDGMNDFTVFIMSTGQILVYSGDPGSTFSIVGNFKAAPPIGYRCTAHIGGELIIITSGGYFTLSNIMAGQIRPEDALSGKIRRAASSAYQNGKAYNGWDVATTSDNSKIIVNVPTTATTFSQHVFSTIGKGWGRWIDRHNFSMGSLNDELYGGFAGGEVYKLETGKIDESRGGANIEGYVVQAFNSFQSFFGQRTKQATNIRPFVSGSGSIDCTFALWSNYRIGELASNLNVLNPGGQPWEQYTATNWEDWTLAWGSDQGGVSTINLSANVLGDTFAPAVKLDTNQTFQWFSTDLILKPGGIR